MVCVKSTIAFDKNDDDMIHQTQDLNKYLAYQKIYNFFFFDKKILFMLALD
jgi:hypothetical protein